MMKHEQQASRLEKFSLFFGWSNFSGLNFYKKRIMMKVQISLSLMFLTCFVMADKFEINAGTRVVHAANAAKPVKISAANLARVLSVMTNFELKAGAGTGDESNSIIVGTAQDFPALSGRLPQKITTFDDTEQYRLKSSGGNLAVIGSEPLGVSCAVWGLLNKLGYRHFFPNPHWEIIPQLKNLSVDIDIYEHPSYNFRRIWAYENVEYPQWAEHNRMGGVPINSSHVYQTIYAQNKAFFESNPDCMAFYDGKRRNPGGMKFCPSNPAMKAFIQTYAREHIAKRPAEWVMSMEPSDGGGWCQCENCKKLGNISDQAVTLANFAAEAIQGGDIVRYVGLLGYNQHCGAPQKTKINDKIIIVAVAGFLTNGKSVEDNIRSWQAAGASSLFGVYEYSCIIQWDYELFTARFGNLKYIKDKIAEYHQIGVRFFDAESGGRSGAIGLGSYLAACYLWDVGNTAKEQALIDDFLSRSFGKAAETMREYFRLTDGASKVMIGGDWFKRAYSVLQKAYSETDDPSVTARLDDLAVYVRYVELYDLYRKTPADKGRQAAFDQYMTHVYRQRDRMMVSSEAISFWSPANGDKSVTNEGKTWKFAAKYKDETPFAAGEIKNWIDCGVKNYKRLDFAPVTYSNNLRPAGPLKLRNKPCEQTDDFYCQSPFKLRFWHAGGQDEVSFAITHGIIPSYRTFMPKAKVELFADANPLLNAIASLEIPIDGKKEDYRFKSGFSGLHTLSVDNCKGAIRVVNSGNVPAVRTASPDDPLDVKRPLIGYIYIPSACREVGGYLGSGYVKIYDDSNKLIYEQANKADHFLIKVPEDQCGKTWKINTCTANLQFLTIPPYIARTPQELLLPAELLPEK